MICINAKSFIDLHLGLIAKIMDVNIVCLVSLDFEQMAGKEGMEQYYASIVEQVENNVQKRVSLYTDLPQFYKNNCTVVVNPQVLESATIVYKRTCTSIEEAEHEFLALLTGHKLLPMDVFALLHKLLFRGQQIRRKDLVGKESWTPFQWLLCSLFSRKGVDHSLDRRILVHSIYEPRIAVVYSGEITEMSERFNWLHQYPNIDTYLNLRKPSLPLFKLRDLFSYQAVYADLDFDQVMANISQYETMHNFKYDIVISLHTNVNIKCVDWLALFKEIQALQTTRFHFHHNGLNWFSHRRAIETLTETRASIAIVAYGSK